VEGGKKMAKKEESEPERMLDILKFIGKRPGQ
jgi:hypothetical protein